MSPETALKMVDLPALLAPTMATNWPSSTEKETSCSTGMMLYRTDTELTLSMVVLAQVGLDDAFVPNDLFRRTLDDQLPRVEDGDPLRDVHDHFHDVFHDNEGETHPMDFPDQLDGFVGLG